MTTFVDRVELHVAAGNGGHGCMSVHREKFKPLGGPDGGNGGKGGDVVLVVDPNVHTLLDFHFRPNLMAENGRQGQGHDRHGANGADLVVNVPNGTVVQDTDGEVLVDLVGPGTSFVIAAGGRGGRGNAALANTHRRAPGFAELGHVVALASAEPGRDPVGDIEAIEAELAAYGGLADRPRIVALNKVDVPHGRDLAEIIRADLSASAVGKGLPIFEVSAVSRE